MVFDEAPDMPPDYVFDVNADVDVGDAFWHRPTGTTISQNNQNDDLLFANGAIQQDFNNNDGIGFDDVECDANDNITNRIQMSKGEYAYNAFSNIRNFWAGPSYWKYSKNLNQSQQATTGKANPKGRRKKRPCAPAIFDDEEDTSADELFIKVKSKEAKKLRHLNRTSWKSDRLKLPPQCDFPSDYFAKRNYNRHSDASTDSMEQINEQNYQADDMDFGVSLTHHWYSLRNFSLIFHLNYWIFVHSK